MLNEPYNLSLSMTEVSCRRGRRATFHRRQHTLDTPAPKQVPDVLLLDITCRTIHGLFPTPRFCALLGGLTHFLRGFDIPTKKIT